MKIKFIMLVLILIPFTASADLLTYKFVGFFTESQPLYTSGDSFTGFYTFDTTAVMLAHPDPSLQTQSPAINDSLSNGWNVLVGTGWNISVNSSTVGAFSLNGNFGWIDIGDNTAFGDRYIVDLSGGGQSLPLGGSFTGTFQMDFYQPSQNGSTMLSTGTLFALPDLQVSGVNSGARFVSDGVQHFMQITSIENATVVPIPPSIALFVSGLLEVVTT